MRIVIALSCMAVVAAFSDLALSRGAFGRRLASVVPTLNPFRTMSGDIPKGEKDFGMYTDLKPYYQLVVDDDGGTSIVKRTFSDTEKVGYSNTPQLVNTLNSSVATPSDIVFTALEGDNPFHHCPAPQIVVCLGGGWYVRTTDGVVTEFHPGDVLFQDNVRTHPAAENGTRRAMHFSGSLGDRPCDQMIVQLHLTDGPIANSKDAPPPM